jgi:hypothetical protein
MNTMTRLTTLFALITAITLPALSSATESTLPPAAAFYTLIGKWQGQGEFGETGQPPAMLALNLECQKTSAGFGVSCHMQASNKEMAIAETDLFGYDPVSNTFHWYSVTNTGETHDHKAQWTDTHTMKANYTWTQEGAKMAENITFKFNGNNNMLFESVVSKNGQQVAHFKGTLKR